MASNRTNANDGRRRGVMPQYADLKGEPRDRGRTLSGSAPAPAPAPVRMPVPPADFQPPLPRGVRPQMNMRSNDDYDSERVLYSSGAEAGGQGSARDRSRERMQLTQQVRQQQPTEPLYEEPQQEEDARQEEEDTQAIEPVNQRARPPMPLPPPLTTSDTLHVPKVTIEDIDRMWDWIRADVDKGAAFFSRALRTSEQLRMLFSGLNTAELMQTGLVRAIYFGREHLGFAMLVPMMTVEKIAVMHVYLRKEARGSLQHMIAPLIDLAEQEAPGYHLAVFSADPAWAKLHRQLLPRLGFTEHTIFVR